MAGDSETDFVFLQETEQNLWKCLKEGNPLSQDAIQSIIDSPEYERAARQRNQDLPVIKEIRAIVGGSSGWMYSERLLVESFAFEGLLRRFMPFKAREKLDNLGSERVKSAVLVGQINELMGAIPGIQAMQEAKDKKDNPVLGTKAAREVFETFDGLTQGVVRDVLLSVRYDKDESKLEDSLTLFKATRPASPEEKIAEISASLKENPAQSIGSGIQDVAQQAAQSLTDWVAGGVKAVQNFINRGQDR